MAVGQKLEEARNRKGISIREASESTKIRGDYLTAFEAGNFDLKLPDVYLRGFIRVYARFLGIDPESAVADLKVELGVKPSKPVRKNLGTISSTDNTDPQRELKNVSRSQRSLPSNFLSNKVIILTFSGVALAILFLSLLVYVISPKESSSDIVDDKPNQSSSIRETQTEANSFNTQTNARDVASLSPGRVLKLAAIGPIERLIISDEGKSPKVFHEFKTLQVGWETSIPFTESFRCYSSSLENIRFAVDDGAEKQVSGQGSGNFRWTP